MQITTQTRRFKDGRGEFHEVDYQESGKVLSLKSHEFPTWTILREENPDGTYDVVAVTEAMVHGYEQPPSGYCAYENITLEDWKKLVKGFVRGSFSQGLGQALDKVETALWRIIDEIDVRDFP